MKNIKNLATVVFLAIPQPSSAEIAITPIAAKVVENEEGLRITPRNSLGALSALNSLENGTKGILVHNGQPYEAANCPQINWKAIHVQKRAMYRFVSWKELGKFNIDNDRLKKAGCIILLPN